MIKKDAKGDRKKRPRDSGCIMMADSPEKHREDTEPQFVSEYATLPHDKVL